jgi:peptidoglycan/LPS O-acetylase OafA/YrhL
MSEPKLANPLKVVRTDIQALRTIAVSLVVLFHLWPNRMPGGFIGVDVFFVISGFLITKHILHEVEAGDFSVTGFWARRIKRLLPASFIVLAITALAVVLLAPISDWAQWLGEVQASVFYFENWNLASSAVDYLALANQASPVQHFWSLSTEEQFYFVWPLLVALAIYIAAKFGKQARARRAIFLALFVVAIASLAYGTFYTQAEPAIAYFSTPVRAWEFAFGALVVFVPAMQFKSQKHLMALLGLSLILIAAFVIDTTTPFPGIAALLPVAGTAAVIVAAIESGWLSKVLAIKPIQWLGDKSYAIYLWHWPVLILAPLVLNRAPTLGNKIGLLAITVVLSWLTQKFIETPMALARPPKWKIFAIAATASVFIASLSGLAVQIGNQQIADELKFGKSGSVSKEQCFGAAARATKGADCVNDKLTGTYPALAVAPSDIPKLPDACFSVTREQVAASFCALGDRSAAVRIAAVGDSHIAHYAGALNALAFKNHWAVDLYAKGGCPFSYAVRVHDAVLTKNCPAWVVNVVAKISNGGYDIAVTSQRAGVAWVGGNTSAVNGLTKLWSQLTANSLPIVAIKDNPNPGQKIPACLLSGRECLSSKTKALQFDPQVQAATEVPAVKLANFDDIYCDELNCLPVIGHVVVYRDDNHLTDTFARTLAPYLEVEIRKLLKH